MIHNTGIAAGLHRLPAEQTSQLGPRVDCKTGSGRGTYPAQICGVCFLRSLSEVYEFGVWVPTMGRDGCRRATLQRSQLSALPWAPAQRTACGAHALGIVPAGQDLSGGILCETAFLLLRRAMVYDSRFISPHTTPRRTPFHRSRYIPRTSLAHRVAGS